ncbi:transmembrane and coiled-coil domains 4 [Ophiocordyceps camponoti-floridani]|uniref:Transmembrane and coiled-coil domains 4 n=1 Tax=Ophiocordyceps camponoti-floridani TaxID=2030778 RepID=A0A8H4Q869_9HYPO|nr:transmembrane and coiled-coil domains 4 [Ophiocordyceps camponoti-floridani]
MIAQLETPSENLGPISPETVDDKAPASNSADASQNPGKEAKSVQLAAIEHITQWRDEFLPRLREIVDVKDTPAIEAEREAKNDEPKDKPDNNDKDITQLQSLYTPLQTPLSTLPPKPATKS